MDDGGDVTLLIHKGYELENGSDWVNTPSGSHEEKVIKDLLKKVHAEDPQRWHKIVEGMARRFRRDHHRRAPPLQDAGTGQAAGSRHQRQRFRHEDRSSTISTAAANRWPTASSARPTSWWPAKSP